MLRRRAHDAAVRVLLYRLGERDRICERRRLSEDSRMRGDANDAREHLFRNRESRLPVHEL